MAKRLIKKYMPDHKMIKEHKSLQFFGDMLHNPLLWHFNRKSVSGAFAVGLFCTFVPMPFQMILAAAVAIFIHVNLPLSVALVWISNPITIPPIFYAAYKFGAWVLNSPVREMEFSLSWEWLSNEMTFIWEPFLLGSLLFSIISSITGFALVRFFWRRHIIHEWHNRHGRFNR